MRATRNVPSRLAEAALRALLWLFPADFRHRHGADMREYLRDAWRDATPQARRRMFMRFALSTIGTAWRQRWRQLGESRSVVDQRADPLVRELLSDVAYAARLFRRSPVFTAVAVVTLALGVGANTAIFSLVNAALLRPLPYFEPDALVSVWLSSETRGVTREMASLAEVLDWQEQVNGLSALGGFGPMGFTLVGDDGARNIEAVLTTPGLFTVLGVPPLYGRALRPEDTEIGAAPVIVVSHWLWEQQFDGETTISTATLELDGSPVQVVGVMPPSFRLATRYLDNIGIYAPFTYERGSLSRESRWLEVVGRLDGNATIQQVGAELEEVAAGLAQLYPDTNDGWNTGIRSLHSDVIGDHWVPLLILQSAVGFVLLIACANVANLLLGRVQSRQAEIAVRRALGARRGRLVRQLLTESLLLALIGGGLGLLLARQSLSLVAAVLPSGVIEFGEMALDARVVAFTLAAAVATGMLFGLAPSWRATRAGSAESLRIVGGRTNDGRRLRQCLIVAEVALALVLLFGASLLMRSFDRLMAVDLGIRTSNVLAFQIAPGGADASQRTSLYRQVLDRLRRLPDVEHVGATTVLPLLASDWTTEFEVPDDALAGDGRSQVALYYSVTPDYFESIGARLVRGRDFGSRDEPAELGAAIINETMATAFWPDRDPIGRSLTIDMRFAATDTTSFRIVGIASDIRDGRPDETVRPAIYVPYTQQSSHHMNFVVRTVRDPIDYIDSIRAEIAAVSPSLPLDEITTLDRVYASSVSDRRFNMLLLASFAMLALILAAVGIYGVMASLVSERTHEIGIRMALGAGSAAVLRSVVAEALLLTGIGILIGGFAASGVRNIIASLLYDLQTGDPVSTVLVPAVLAVVAAGASYLPARRATRVDPAVALRD